MNSHNTNYLNEAVRAVIKGHLTLEDASSKYSIPVSDFKAAMKNYCVSGEIKVENTPFYKRVLNHFSFMDPARFFKSVAPTYDCEKKLDRFKFKFAYTMASFLVIAAGMAMLNLPALYNPIDSNAGSFEDKLDKTLMTSSKRPKAIDAEVKYLNKFYSKINKILAESKSGDSKALKAEVERRLKYISEIDREAIAKKGANFTDISMGKPVPKSQEIYSNLYQAAKSGDPENYVAKTFRQRVDDSIANEKNNLTAIKNLRTSYKDKEVACEAEPAEIASSEDNVPMVEESDENERGKVEISEASKPSKKRFESKRAEIARAAEEIQVAETTYQPEQAVKNVAKSAKISDARAASEGEKIKTYQYKKNNSLKNFDSLKDKLYIINRYKRQTMLKKAIVKCDIKFKQPMTDFIVINDKAKYNESLKKIAINKDYNAKDVKMSEDRG